MQPMTARSSEHGGAAELRRWLPLALFLIVLAGLEPLDMSAIEAATRAARAFGADRPDAIPVLRAASYIGFGWLSDRFGPRRAVALGLCASAAAATLGAAADGPLAFTAVHWAVTLSKAGLWISGFIALSVAVPIGWRALALAALFLAGRGWDTGIAAYEIAIFRAEAFDVEAGQRMLFLAAGLAGSLAAASWLALVRGGDGPPRGRALGDDDVSIRRLTWLVAADLCGTIAFRAVEHRVVPFVEPRLAFSTVGSDAMRVWSTVAFAAALLGASLWSDAVRRSGASSRDARGPAILAGLLAASLLAVVPAVQDPQSLFLLVAVATAGASAAMITLPAIVDASPLGLIGRVLAVDAALGAVGPFFADRLVSSVAPPGSGQMPDVIWGGLAALLGTGAVAAAFRLPSPRP